MKEMDTFGGKDEGTVLTDEMILKGLRNFKTYQVIKRENEVSMMAVANDGSLLRGKGTNEAEAYVALLDASPINISGAYDEAYKVGAFLEASIG